jgi:hypothetical protein
VLKIRMAALFVTLAALLGLGATTANAQVQIASAPQATPAHQAAALACTGRWWVTGDGVRIRKYAGSVILGYAWYGETVNLMGRYGNWVDVFFPNRPANMVRRGWISNDYLGC